METLLAVYGAPWTWTMTQEPWLAMLIVSLVLTAKLSLGGWVLAKAGRSPLWVLILLLPWAEVPMLWFFAYSRWPSMPGGSSAGSAAQSPP